MATADLLQATEKPLTVRRKSNRSALWLAMHGWLGLPVWAFMFFVCLTGSVATVSEEIIWVINPAARAAAPSAAAQKLTYDQIVARVKAQQPEAYVSAISIPVKDMFAWHVRIDRPGGNFVLLYVNPYTGDIQGEMAGFDLRQFLRALHGWLLVPFTNMHSLGWYVVSALSIPLLGSLITGLVVYKKFWRAFLLPRLRLNSGSKIFGATCTVSSACGPFPSSSSSVSPGYGFLSRRHWRIQAAACPASRASRSNIPTWPAAMCPWALPAMMFPGSASMRRYG